MTLKRQELLGIKVEGEKKKSIKLNALKSITDMQFDGPSNLKIRS